jgi:hypothetical protein
MRRTRLPLFLAIVCVGIAPTRGEEPLVPSLRTPAFDFLVHPRALLRFCCDTYCPKPLPWIRPYCGGCGDIYCGKPCPYVSSYGRACTCDSYCSKPCPDLCTPLSAHYFTCVDSHSACEKSLISGLNDSKNEALGKENPR